MYGPPATRLLFDALLRSVPPEKRDLFIRRGDLLAWQVAHDAPGLAALADSVFECSRPVWASMTQAMLAEALSACDIWILAVEGLSSADVGTVDSALRKSEGYLGAIEIYPANRMHWALYDRKLLAAYRVCGDELRLLAISAALDPEARDEGSIREWRESGLFRQVEWEDIGLRDTVFDHHFGFDSAKRVAEIEDRLGDSLGPLVGVVMMRIASLQPNLFDTLHAAIAALDRAESAEQFAQASLSCRRFLGQLADILYPITSASSTARKVGPEKYRNRLWAYIEENFPSADRNRIQGTYQELGHRLDALDERTQRHVHGPGGSREDTTSLILGLTVWTHDVLTLTPHPSQGALLPHWDSFDQFVRAMIRRHGSDLH